MQSSDLTKAVNGCVVKHAVLGLSVYSADVPDLESLMGQAPATLQDYGTVSLTTAGLVRDLWCVIDLLPTFQAPHYTVVVSSIEEEVFEALRSIMAPQPNPLKPGP